MSETKTFTADAIRADPQARRFFESLATHYRTNYVSWVDLAKRPETRSRRVAEVVHALRLAAASTASARLRKTSGRGTHGRLRQGRSVQPGHASPASRSLTSQRWRWTSVPRVYRGGSIARPR